MAIKRFLISLLVLPLVPLSAQAAVDRVEFDAMHTHYSADYYPPEGMTKLDFVTFRRAISELKSSRAPLALESLKSLHESYPQNKQITFYLGQAYNLVGQAEQALLVLDPLAEQQRENELGDAERLPVLTEQIKAYVLQKQPDTAYKLFQQYRLNPDKLSKNDLQDYKFMEVDLLLRTGNLIQAHKLLSDFDGSESISRRRQDILRQNAVRLGRVYYDLAKKHFDEREYLEAFKHARIAYELDHTQVSYLNLSNQAHEYVLAGIRMRFQRALPRLRNYMSDMRYDLDLADYDDLYRIYAEFKLDKDVSFVLEDVYRDYLPSNMYEVLSMVEKTLVRRGYQL